MSQHSTLDPKNDVVFKLLFTREHNKALLKNLITAFLKPPHPIVDVTVLNPELLTEDDGRGLMVDLLVVLTDRQRVHVEMQLCNRGRFVERGLLYWARAFSSQLARAESFDLLRPTASIFFLNYRELPCADYYSVFQLLETTRHERLTDALTLHFVELPKISSDLVPSGDADPVLKWAWFFKANSDEERHTVAMADPTLRDAETALRQLSDDPIAREYAYRRELELIHFQNQLAREHEQGIADGRIECIAEVRIAATRRTIEHLCVAFALPLDERRRTQLTNLDLGDLETLQARIIETRTWPL
jgi:predicted transposase/invertase (TIGR01784 family)